MRTEVWPKNRPAYVMTQSRSADVHPEPRLSCAPSPSSLKAFRYPKRQFEPKGEERSFHAEWCDAPGSGSSTVHSLLSTKAITA